MKKENNKKGRPQITNIVLSIISIFAIVALIINITTTNKDLERIIYNAKKEAENTLASTGRMIYAEDVENIIEAGSVSARNDLPENTFESQQPVGTIVRPKENWNIETVRAVSVGNGETIPVPIGFYYVGGDLNTGVVISDSEEDKYDGITDKTTWEYTTSLKGNQFVWIPCKEQEYQKCFVWNGMTQTDTTFGNGLVMKKTETSELPQIRKYEGFYVARYEAGLAETITEFTSAQKDGTQVYNKEGIPQAKAGIIPWNFIDYNHAYTNARNMYNTEAVSSGLITGTEWDVILKILVGKKMYDGTELTELDLTNSEKWGNHCNNSIEYTGRKARLTSGRLLAFGGKETNKTTIYGTGGNGDLLTTGASKQTGVYNIYDLAGSLWEYTEETSVNAGKIGYTIRGGSFAFPSNNQTACNRGCGADTNICSYNWGFRVLLYIK